MVVKCTLRHLEFLWRTVEPWLERAMHFHPFMDARDLREIIEKELADLLLVIEDKIVVGAVVLEAVQYPRMRVCNVIAVGGQTGSLKRHHRETSEAIRAWSTENGCSKLGALARRGWARYFTARGWAFTPYLYAWRDA